MFSLNELRRPVIAAPMAGGVSVPELVIAAADAGGLGFLAAGYKSVDDVLAQAHRVRMASGDPFGVNLFMPGAPANLDAASAYRGRLAGLAVELGVELPEPYEDDDAFDAKCAALWDAPVPVVSFTFGCPGADVIRRFRQAGTFTIATVTSVDEAAQATASGVDALVVQGPEAGGHRGTFDAHATPPTQPLDALLLAVRAATDLPLIAAGGLGTASAIAEALRTVDAVQLGTAFVDADEAGTSPVHRRALHDPRFIETALTRAFSGRVARALRNDFIDAYGPDAPPEYPALNQLTGPLRKAAAQSGDAEIVALWAGTSWRTTQTASVATILDNLL